MTDKVIVITGPTASGKTGLGIRLSQEIEGEIVSADSRMVYQGLDIGTGKPTWEYRKLSTSPWLKPVRQVTWGPIYTIEGVPHHLLDIIPPETRFSLTDWLAHAQSAIADIRARGKRPIIVGGTGLYVNALVQGYTPPPTDPAIRTAIDRLTTEEILAELQKVDPETARRESKNRRRLVRALEVFRLTGQPFSSASRNTSKMSPRLIGSGTVILAIDWPRDELYRRIDLRTQEQIAGGMIDEVRTLLDRGVSADWLTAIGLEYRIVTNWLVTHGGLPLSSRNQTTLLPEKQLQGAIHAYARRQLTYLRYKLPVRWLAPQEAARLMESKGATFRKLLNAMVVSG